MNHLADMFYKYEYTETRELLKMFIALLSATLVFSLTFAEKIVDFQKAAQSARRRLIAAWVLFVCAIILCGVSMCLIAAAAGKVIYGSIPFLIFDYGDLALGSWICIIIAGVCFVSGLISMVSAAIISTRATPGAAAQSTATSPAR